jgi:DNA-binding response OmpR family regulator
VGGVAIGRRALVVEDDPASRLAVEKRLRLDLFETLGVASGLSGLHALRAWRPDLVVVDLALNGMSGLDLLRMKARDPALAGIPVLVVTSSQDLDVLAGVYALGAGACLGKPYNPERLSALARNLVRRPVAL